MKVSLVFYLNEEKKATSSQSIPVYVRVRTGGKKAEGRLYHANVLEKEKPLWDEGTMRLRATNHKVNKLINTVQRDFDEFIIMKGKEANRFSANSIRDLLLGRNKRVEPTLVEYIDSYYVAAVHNNTTIAKGTKKNYVKAIRHLKAFLFQTKQSGLLVGELNSTVANSFKDYLLCESGDGKRNGMTEPSALGNIKKFRTIFDRAVDEGLLEKNPFKTVKLKNRSPQKPRLSIQQVRALLTLDLTKYPRLIPYRDLFVFSCFTGLAYEDAHNLSYSDLINIRGGETKIYLAREKTDILTEVVLVSPAKAIIEKYRKEAENQITRRVLPQRSNQKINMCLKALSTLIEIPFELKTHLARHTFRQLLGEAGIADSAVIKRMMGHSRSSDIDNVYYQVTEEKLITAAKKLERYLDEHLNQE